MLERGFFVKTKSGSVDLVLSVLTLVLLSQIP